MIKFLLAGLAIAVLCFTTYDAQGAVFLKIDSISGDSTVVGHENEIGLSSYQFGANLALSSSGGGTIGKSSTSDITVTKSMDKSSPNLLQELFIGDKISKAEIFLTKTSGGGKQFTFAHYTLNDVLITGYSVSSGGDLPSESLSLNFAKLQTETIPQNPDGSLGKTVSFCWDSALNKECTVSAPPGSFNDPSNGNAITPCPAGSYCPDGTTAPITCPAGSYCPDPASNPLLCPAGTYSSTGSIACTQAPPGSYAIGPGATSATLCPAGTFSANPGSASCTQAPPGSYIPSTGTISPTLCPAGTYCPDPGTTNPLTCPAGDFCGVGTVTPLPQTESINPSTGGGQVTFNTNAGGFTNLSSIPAGSLPTPPPPGSYPIGFFSWSITGFAPSPSATIQITSPVPLLSQSNYFKLVGGTWVGIPVIVSGNKMNITITDNGPFDGNALVGTISDPGAITNPTNGRISGGGSIGSGIELGFEVKSDLSKTKTIRGELEYHDKSTKINLHSEKITFLSVDTTVSQATFLGSLDLDKKHKGSFIAIISDPDKKGENDKFSIAVSDDTGKVIYQKSGNVKGHIEIHKFFDKDDKSDSGTHQENDKSKH